MWCGFMRISTRHILCVPLCVLTFGAVFAAFAICTPILPVHSSMRQGSNNNHNNSSTSIASPIGLFIEGKLATNGAIYALERHKCHFNFSSINFHIHVCIRARTTVCVCVCVSMCIYTWVWKIGKKTTLHIQQNKHMLILYLQAK